MKPLFSEVYKAPWGGRSRSVNDSSNQEETATEEGGILNVLISEMSAHAAEAVNVRHRAPF